MRRRRQEFSLDSYNRCDAMAENRLSEARAFGNGDSDINLDNHFVFILSNVNVQVFEVRSRRRRVARSLS